MSDEQFVLGLRTGLGAALAVTDRWDTYTRSRIAKLIREIPASADTHPKGGDVQQAPSPMGSAVGNAETPEQHRLSPSQPSKG